MRLTCSAAQGLLLVMKTLLLLMIISLPAHAYNDGEMNGNGIAEIQSFISAHDQDEDVNAFTTATKMKMEQLGGRKMAVPRKLEMAFHGGATPQIISEKVKTLVEKMLNVGSFKRIYAGRFDPHPFVHQEPNMQKTSGILGSSRHEQVRHSTKTKVCEESKAMPTRASSEGPDNLLIKRLVLHDHSPPKPEKQRLLLEGMVKLMHKDYNGVDKPRRKPPINNHVPIH